MSSILLSGPAVEPVALDDAKSFLKVETDDDDDVIAALIAGARVHVEAQTRRALITQSWRLIRDAWPDNGRIAITPAPLQALNAARVYRLDGTTQAIDPAAFAVDRASAPPVLAFSPGVLPAPGRVVAGIEIDVTVGHGDAPEDVPADLRQAIRILVAHWYENRGLIAVGNSVAVLPQTATALILPHRVRSL
jgi:uncharacterized phiE125 gp8 family phage protein